jgi:hypothetical protein
MMLMRWLSQEQVVAADVIVIPRSCSCSIQSIVAAPSCTSPICADERPSAHARRALHLSRLSRAPRERLRRPLGRGAGAGHHLVRLAGVEQDALRAGRLAGVDVRADADVAIPL